MNKIILILLLINLKKIHSYCPDNCLCYLNNEPKKITCSHQGLNEYPAKISDLVEHFDLSDNNLRIIVSDIGRLIELRYLNLAKNQLTGLPGDIGELWKLERLDLSENKIHNVGIDIGVITRLPNLKILSLGKNPITDIQELSNAALKYLDVNKCTILRITNETLEGLPELISLNMEDNPLITVKNIKSNKLKWLDMSNCRLSILESNTFEGAPLLEQLRLANNPYLIFSTRKETLRHDKLKKLDASGCNLDRPGLHGFPSLTQAILSKNSIRFLPDNIFSRNKMLINLSLDGNGLDQINSSTFYGMTSLETLDLSRNSLTYLHSSLFKENINLRLLNLSNNNIREIPDDFLSTVITLDLSMNLIDNISNKCLINMTRIKNLNLGKNRFELFDNSLESNTLRTLNLENNRIIKLTNKSFLNIPLLTGLDLSGNRLSEDLSKDIFSSNNNLQKILLHDNPWHCDCDKLESIYNYLKSTEKTIMSNLICQSPSNVSGYSWTTACYTDWSNDVNDSRYKDKIYQLVLMGLFICVFIFGTVVSIGHTIRTKRSQALLRIREAERAEARERLLLHRRTLEIESRRQEHQPRIHPAEIIGPPTYEEAVQLPRLIRSLDHLDSISTEGIGNSGQSLDKQAWIKKRRMQSKKIINKRAKSEDNLNRKCREKNKNIKGYSTSSVSRERRRKSTIIYRQNDNSYSDEPISSMDDIQRGINRSRTSITNNKKRKRFLIIKNEHSNDDEDSDNYKNISSRSAFNLNNDKNKIFDLSREPRSGTYRPTCTTSTSPQFYDSSSDNEIIIHNPPSIV